MKSRRRELLGIIGRNGAGKSTLLKILSSVTAPTSGQVNMKGRIASLLEVGTGFHPDLTGRENIYLNGAILGMTRQEVRRKFDEIVAFSEIEDFIDTPVKRYSSGMYVRLAFAVAAHLEPEILLVDEVLAVGDAAFQKKCLGKMGDVAKEGRTVLFVSHSMPMISRLCERVILLTSGMITKDSKTQETISFYMNFGTRKAAEIEWADRLIAPGDSIARLKTVRILNSAKQVTESVDIEEPLFIEIEYWNMQYDLKPTAIIHLVNEEGITLFASNDWNNSIWWNTPRKPGLIKCICKIPGNYLAEGRFFVLVAIGTYNPNQIHVLEKDIVSFQVIDRTEGKGVRGTYSGSMWPGVIRPMLDWYVSFNDQDN